MNIDEIDKKIISQLQGELPLVPEPFAYLASQIGITENDYIKRVEAMQASGIIRRLAAVLRQRESGYEVNAMLVWQENEQEADQVGAMLAELDFISHLYLRAADEIWPYNMYAMVHARSEEELEGMYRQVVEKTGNKEVRIIKSVREFKKTSMQYFFKRRECQDDTH